MKKWIARKLFDLAVRLDWDEAVKGALAVVLVDGHMKAAFAPPKKRGRPLGSKDSVGPKKRGRPVGSKNRPKAVTP
jgi:hypothetical protein